MTRIALDIDSTLHHYWDLLDGPRKWGWWVQLAQSAGILLICLVSGL